MKIAIICKNTSFLENEFKALADSIYESGTDVTLMAPDNKRLSYDKLPGSDEQSVEAEQSDSKADSQAAKLFGYDFYSFDYSEAENNRFTDMRTLFSLISALRQDKPDLVLCASARLCAITALAAKLTGVLEVYSVLSDLEQLMNNSSAFKKLRSGRLAKRISRLSTKVIFHNTDTMLYFINKGLVKQKKASLVNGFGVDVNKFPKADYSYSGSFLMISDLSTDKGILEFAQTADIIKMLGKDATFTLVGYDAGSPESFDFIRPYIKNGSLNFVRGEECDTAELLKQCSYFVYPSYNEGIPGFVLEALATGRPVITTDVSGCRDTVNEGYNGYVIPVQSVEKLVETILGIIEDSSKSQKMAENSYELVKNKFDRTLTNERLLEIMELNGGM